MEGDNDVGQTAAQCMSQDYSELLKGMRKIRRMVDEYQADQESSGGPKDHMVPVVRFLQELASYRKGCVVKQLIVQLPITQLETPLLPVIQYASLSSLVALAANRLISQFIVGEAGPILVLTNLTLAPTIEAEEPPLKCQLPAEVLGKLLADSMEGLFYFARASKDFRMAVHESESLAVTLQNMHRKLSAEAPFKKGCKGFIRDKLADFIATLTVHKDSREWILEWRWLDVFIELFKSESIVQRMGGDVLCQGLCALLIDSDTCQALKAMNALSLLRPLNKKIEKITGGKLWPFMKDLLACPANVQSSLCQSTKVILLEDIDCDHIPVVCSWKDCAAGPEPLLGEKYKSCSGCGLAAYCSKEHQIRDWPAHKRNCRFLKSQESTGGDTPKSTAASKKDA